MQGLLIGISNALTGQGGVVDPFPTEVIVNGDFATNSDWQLVNGAFIASNQLTMPDTSNARQVGTVPVNTQAKLLFEGTGNVRYRLGPGEAYIDITLPFTDIVTTPATAFIQFLNQSGLDVILTKVSVKI
jgi:hypothetical protein